MALRPGEHGEAGVGGEPSRLNKYAVARAQQFHHFYNACRIKCDDEKLCAARLALCLATRQAVANTLGLIGVEAPETM